MKLKPWVLNLFKSKSKEPTETPPTPESKEQPDENKRQYVSGKNVIYIIPDDMNKLTARILSPNGTYINQYVLSRYLSLGPGYKIQIIIE